MLHKKKGAIEWLEFELFAKNPQIVHGIFLRHGGCSDSNFASLNLMRNKGDCHDNVNENQKRISEILQVQKIAYGTQVHSSQIALIQNANTQNLQCDALMTNHKGLGLMAVHADCQAAIIYDPVHHAIATVHAGWRGQVQNIYRETIRKMGVAFNSQPQELLVGISPSLGPENSEFKNYSQELPGIFWPFQVKPTYFDLWAVAEFQLLECGVLSRNIEIAKMDTYANTNDFFSYRRQRAQGHTENITGGHGTVVALL